MFDRLTLTHACGARVDLVTMAGVWTTPAGRVITHCDTCGEWLGSGFTGAEEYRPRRRKPDKAA